MFRRCNLVYAYLSLFLAGFQLYISINSLFFLFGTDDGSHGMNQDGECTLLTSMYIYVYIFNYNCDFPMNGYFHLAATIRSTKNRTKKMSAMFG